MDSLSFWLGFLAATILWFLIQYIRRLWPQLKEVLDSKTASIRQINAAGAEDRLRKEILLRAQSSHLSSALFPLDEIIVPPRLMAPLPQISPENPAPPADIVSKTISYLPDWPEFGALFGIKTLDVELPLSEGIRLAIVGHPGSGKSTALAYLASRIIRRESPTPELNNLFPLLIHVEDIPRPYPARGDLIKPVFDVVTSSSNSPASAQEQAILRAKLSSGNLIFLLDGIDELNNKSLNELSTYLELLLNQYPQMKITITLSFENWDGFARLGFKPFALAAWTKEQTIHFINQWSSAWAEKILPILSRSSPTRSPDPLIVQNWLMLTQQDRTPLEWTLLVWGVCAGDLKGSQTLDGIESYIKRYKDQLDLTHLSNLGMQMLLQKELQLPESLVAQPDEEELLSTRLASKPKFIEPNRVDPLKSLLVQGFFVKRFGGNLTFAHPVIASYLGAQSIKIDPKCLSDLQSQQAWIGKTIALRLIAAQIDLSPFLSPIIDSSQEPLYYDLFQLARWIKDIPKDHAWRKDIITRLLEFLQREMLPDAIRQRSLAALIQSTDSDLLVIFQKMMERSSPSVTALATLACATTCESQYIKTIVDLLGDSSLVVRSAACLSLASIKNQLAIEALTNTLIHADEDTRMAAAEALANDPLQGHPVLKDGCVDEDILIRRASIAGLSRIEAPWAISILSKIRIEDSQWVIRDAAAQAVEQLERPNPYLPRPLVKPESSPWLITFAAKQGVGIPANTTGTEMLLYALKGGEEEERLGALEYLRSVREPEVFQALQDAVVCPFHSVREYSTNILYELLHSGENITPPADTEQENTNTPALFNRL